MELYERTNHGPLVWNLAVYVIRTNLVIAECKNPFVISIIALHSPFGTHIYILLRLALSTTIFLSSELTNKTSSQLKQVS